jgi:hypothetical protein
VHEREAIAGCNPRQRPTAGPVPCAGWGSRLSQEPEPPVAACSAGSICSRNGRTRPPARRRPAAPGRAPNAPRARDGSS